MSNDKPVVLFDGQCNFCRSQIEILRRLDGKRRLIFQSFHEPSVRERFQDLSTEQLMEQMWVIAPDGAKYPGAYAVRYLATILPILWPVVPLMYIPFSMGIWQSLYRFVARNRYRIAGRNCDEGGTCSLHYHAAAPSKNKRENELR